MLQILELKKRIEDDGKVGIGTTSPARTLDLTAAGQITFGDGVTGDYTARYLLAF